MAQSDLARYAPPSNYLEPDGKIEPIVVCSYAACPVLTWCQRRQSLSRCNIVAEWSTNCPIYLRRLRDGRAGGRQLSRRNCRCVEQGRPLFPPSIVRACITRAITAENTSFALQGPKVSSKREHVPYLFLLQSLRIAAKSCDPHGRVYMDAVNRNLSVDVIRVCKFRNPCHDSVQSCLWRFRISLRISHQHMQMFQPTLSPFPGAARGGRLKLVIVNKVKLEV